jgi:hypothetical protein
MKIIEKENTFDKIKNKLNNLCSYKGKNLLKSTLTIDSSLTHELQLTDKKIYNINNDKILFCIDENAPLILNEEDRAIMLDNSFVVDNLVFGGYCIAGFKFEYELSEDFWSLCDKFIFTPLEIIDENYNTTLENCIQGEFDVKSVEGQFVYFILSQGVKYKIDVINSILNITEENPWTTEIIIENGMYKNDFILKVNGDRANKKSGYIENENKCYLYCVQSFDWKKPSTVNNIDTFIVGGGGSSGYGVYNSKNYLISIPSSDVYHEDYYKFFLNGYGGECKTQSFSNLEENEVLKITIGTGADYNYFISEVENAKAMLLKTGGRFPYCSAFSNIFEKYHTKNYATYFNLLDGNNTSIIFLNNNKEIIAEGGMSNSSNSNNRIVVDVDIISGRNEDDWAFVSTIKKDSVTEANFSEFNEEEYDGYGMTQKDTTKEFKKNSGSGGRRVFKENLSHESFEFDNYSRWRSFYTFNNVLGESGADGIAIIRWDV